MAQRVQSTVSFTRRGRLALFGPALLGLLSLGLVGVACGGPQAPQQGGLAGDTAIGKNRCADAATNQLRPFIVEWDATDLASFESKASRDIIFVKYEGCDLTVLEGCSDAGIPGKYGRYQPPVFTSGTLEGFDIKTEDELYAKLPLGVASFGGRLSMGESLKLSYYVTGTAAASRESITQAEIAKNPKCAQATHFVSSYNLGAFELDSQKASAAEAEVGIGDIGGGAAHKRDEKNLKRGGELADCKTQSQRACRVPIRVVLQPLGAGAEASDVAGSATPPPPPAYEQTPAAQAMALRESAKQKRDNGDGSGCLADLDRAYAMDSQRTNETLYTRALCEMQAGQCEAGKKKYREYLATVVDKERKLTDKVLDERTAAAANTYCTTASGGDISERITRATAAITQASARGDTARCEEEATAMAKLIPTLPMPKHLPPRASANTALMFAANCLSAAGKCDGARSWYERYYEAQFKGTMSDGEYKELLKSAVDVFDKRCTR